PPTAFAHELPAHQDSSRRGAVGSDDAERQADELVAARADRTQIETFDGHDAGFEQHLMRLLISDREVVDSDEPDTPLDEQLRGAPVEQRELFGELVARPELRVWRLEQKPFRRRRSGN